LAIVKFLSEVTWALASREAVFVWPPLLLRTGLSALSWSYSVDQIRGQETAKDAEVQTPPMVVGLRLLPS
jgi:hypothetical protein